MILKNFRSCIILILLTATTAFGQSYSLSNEELIFSFETLNGKKVTLNKDKENKYIIYRFGSATKIEFEFPGKSKSSWSDFKYSFYLRGGGNQNEGEDLNYIYFTNENYKYVIYDTYFSADEKQRIGIKIINLKTKEIRDIKGNVKTRKGTLVDFRDTNLLEIGDELFD